MYYYFQNYQKEECNNYVQRCPLLFIQKLKDFILTFYFDSLDKNFGSHVQFSLNATSKNCEI